MKPIFFFFLAATGAALLHAEDPFRSHIRPTEPLSPDQEQAGFRLPPGFQARLFASEPDIQKPLNMAFDADGRLWLTCTVDYPLPDPNGNGHDSVRILEDTDGDGAADRVSVFADGLNIPIGLYPYQDGVIVFSIPDILFLRDTDGDGRADRREHLYGPFDTTRDTHGMNNSFRRGFDGWLYCCHGFSNQSTVSGKDGHTVTMHSGNTYRIRLDGSRIEHFTHGQVNPFGMTIDPFGDIFTSDCHTWPVTLLLRDGWYESFGRPHDGMGFVPPVMSHLHGSTAIDGVCQYQGTAFPPEYREDLFLGNVMTCRVHRNTIRRIGSSIRLEKQPDLLVSEDPWFRPVDIQCGADGALYVADFYNRIIGHYEVPLDHPGRDRHRGRIWRITYESPQEPHPPVPRLKSAGIVELLAALDSPAQPVRMHALTQITDRIGPDAAGPLAAALPGASERAEPEILWALSRLNALSPDQLTEASRSGRLRTRIHSMRIAAETQTDSTVLDVIRAGLKDADARVRRAAADAALRHPHIDLFDAVTEALADVPEKDVHLKHALRLALRGQLRSDPVATQVLRRAASVNWIPVADVLPGLRTASVVPLALAAVRSQALSRAVARDTIRHAAVVAPADQLEQLIPAAIELSRASGRIDDAVAMWENLHAGLKRRQTPPPDAFLLWGHRLAADILAETRPTDGHWGLYAWNDEPPGPWGFQDFPAQGHDDPLTFLTSLAGGEERTGVLRSSSFPAPAALEFFLNGFAGHPERTPDRRTRIVLRDSETGAVLRTAFAPGSTTGVPVRWDLVKEKGRTVCLEVEDGIRNDEYAWIGFSHIRPAVVRHDACDLGRTARRIRAACTILSDLSSSKSLKLQEYTPALQRIVATRELDGQARAAAASLLLMRAGPSVAGPVADLLRHAALDRSAETHIVAACRERAFDAEAVHRLLRNVFSTLSARLRQHLATDLTQRPDGADLLLTLMDEGVPSGALLRDERLQQQITAHGPNFRQRVSEILQSLPEAPQVSPNLATQVLGLIRAGSVRTDAGRIIFDRHCRTCHRHGGQGGQAGPQLDGLASRGPERTLEDILFPNANVDVSFRTSVVVFEDGRTLSGLVRELPGDELQIVDVNGKARTVPADSVEEIIGQRLSLMPGSFHQLLKPQELADLVGWLTGEASTAAAEPSGS